MKTSLTHFILLVSFATLSLNCSTATPTAEQNAARSMEALLDVWESGNLELLDSLFEEDATYVDMPNERRLEGIDAIRAYVSHVHAWASQIDMQVDRIRASKDFAYAEWRMTGVQNRPIEGMIPLATNRPFEIAGVTSIDMRDGRITRAVDYIQVMPLILQLGGRIELPGGGEMSLEN